MTHTHRERETQRERHTHNDAYDEINESQSKPVTQKGMKQERLPEERKKGGERKKEKKAEKQQAKRAGVGASAHRSRR